MKFESLIPGLLMSFYLCTVAPVDAANIPNTSFLPPLSETQDATRPAVKIQINQSCCSSRSYGIHVEKPSYSSHKMQGQYFFGQDSCNLLENPFEKDSIIFARTGSYWSWRARTNPEYTVEAGKFVFITGSTPLHVSVSTGTLSISKDTVAIIELSRGEIRVSNLSGGKIECDSKNDSLRCAIESGKEMFFLSGERDAEDLAEQIGLPEQSRLSSEPQKWKVTEINNPAEVFQAEVIDCCSAGALPDIAAKLQNLSQRLKGSSLPGA